jgi:hypothetical protein
MFSKKVFFSIPLFLLIFSASFGQSGVSISGIIKDNFNEALVGASVSLRNNADSFIAGTAAEMDGSFVISNVRPGDYKIKISYLGYDDYIRPLSVAQTAVILGLIKMSNVKSTTLSEVKIESRAIAVQQNEDTTSYNAGSYKVNPDANAADLIRKMPGMDLSSGTPKAQGENITKVLVDGKPFFGDDASSSLQNLPAEIIDKVQVYDEKSEQAQFTGFDDGNTTKTVNIITKPGKKSGTFGKVYAGYGYEDKYDVGGNVNYFEGDRRISLIGLTNNVNIQNFSSQDLVGVSGGRSRRGRGRGNAANNFMINQQDGVSKTNAIGLNYSDKWGKKLEVTGSYFFNNSNNVAEEETNRLYVLPSQSGQTYQETSHSATENYNHRFNLRMNYTIDSNNSILFVPSFSAQTNSSVSSLSGTTLQQAIDVLNQTQNNYQNDLDGYNFTGFLLYRHKFNKQGRTLSLFANGGLNQNEGNSKFFAENLYADPSLDDTLDQQSDFLKNGKNIRANINYTEPLSKKSYLQFRYGFGYQYGSSDKQTYDYSPLTNDYTDQDSLLSNVFQSKYTTNTLGLAYRYNSKQFRSSIGLNYQNALLANVRTLPYPGTLNRTFNNVLPYARLDYRFSKTKNLRLFYRTGTDAPSVDQLQDVINNQNPLQLTSGNPTLKQAYEHTLRIRYNGTNPAKSTTFFAMLGAGLTQDYIGNNTLVAEQDMLLDNSIVLPRGAQFTRPENMSGYWNMNTFLTYGLPINLLRSNLNINVQGSIAQTPGVINDQKNLANNTNAGLGFTFSSNINEKIDFTLSSTGSYNWVKNTVNTGSDNRFYNQSSRLSVNYIFWKGIVFNTDLNHQLYTGLSADYNQNFFLWNMSIGKKLFKKQQGEIKVSVFDLLGQNQSIQRTVSEIYSEDVRTNVLQRYFMLTFTYNLRFFKGGATMPDTGSEGDHGMGVPPHGRHSFR